MFHDPTYNEVHFEFLHGRGVVCQSYGYSMPFWHRDIERVTCPDCLNMYPRLWWDIWRNPHLDPYFEVPDDDGDNLDDDDLWYWYQQQENY